GPSALAKNNYLLFGSSGNRVTIDSATFDSVIPNTVDLAYNGGQPLVVDTYSLYVLASNVHDSTFNLPMAPPWQLVVANAGRNNVSVANLPGHGSIGALSDYAVAVVGPQVPNPMALALADLDGDGIPDLAVVNAGTAQVNIYQGQVGGGYSTNAIAVLSLPA